MKKDIPLFPPCYIYSHNWAVQYLCGGDVHKGHRHALAMLFLEIARFFGSQFHDEKMTNKWCHQFDDALAVKNGTGKKGQDDRAADGGRGDFWAFLYGH